MANYNGWKNYETWNVALWIGNDEGLYRAAVEYARREGKDATYIGFVRGVIEPLGGPWTTPDGVLWLGPPRSYLVDEWGGKPVLDYERLDEMIRELGKED